MRCPQLWRGNDVVVGRDGGVWLSEVKVVLTRKFLFESCSNRQWIGNWTFKFIGQFFQVILVDLYFSFTKWIDDAIKFIKDNGTLFR